MPVISAAGLSDAFEGARRPDGPCECRIGLQVIELRDGSQIHGASLLTSVFGTGLLISCPIGLSGARSMMEVGYVAHYSN